MNSESTEANPALTVIRQAHYLQSIACFVNDAEKHDGLQRKSQKLLAEAERLREQVGVEASRTGTG